MNDFRKKLSAIRISNKVRICSLIFESKNHLLTAKKAKKITQYNFCRFLNNIFSDGCNSDPLQKLTFMRILFFRNLRQIIYLRSLVIETIFLRAQKRLVSLLLSDPEPQHAYVMPFLFV